VPRAVVDVTPIRYDLKSVPEGYVELRRMPYGDWLHRGDISLLMQVEMEEKRQKGKASGRTADMKLQNQAVTTYEFTRCIVGHNLTDDNDRPLDFTKRSTLDILDPKVGNEIGDLIDEMHKPFTEEDEGN
jgi:hypothetical protein